MESLTINRRELLHFMNEGHEDANGHHTAITGLIGEPLAVGLILHSLRSKGLPAEFLSWKVTPGTKSGQRLDAWLSDGAGTLYQTEIKMWAGNAIGGLRLKPDLPEHELAARGVKQWRERIWNDELGAFRADSVGKVLKLMQVPKEGQGLNVKPLLCLWWLVQPNLEPCSKGWFTQQVSGRAFDEFEVFSLTRYLLSLSEEQLTLELPGLPQRLAWLNRIFVDLK